MPRAAPSGAGSDVPSSGPRSRRAPGPAPEQPAALAKGYEQALHRLRPGEGAPMLCAHHPPRICRGLTALGERISRSHRLRSHRTGTEVVTRLVSRLVYSVFPTLPGKPYSKPLQGREGCCMSCPSPLWIQGTVALCSQVHAPLHFSLLHLSHMNAHLHCALDALFC